MIVANYTFSLNDSVLRVLIASFKHIRIETQLNMENLLSLWLVFVISATTAHVKADDFQNLLVDSIIQKTIKQFEKEIDPLMIQEREWTLDKNFANIKIRGLVKLSNTQLYGIASMERVGKTMHTFHCG